MVVHHDHQRIPWPGRSNPDRPSEPCARFMKVDCGNETHLGVPRRQPTIGTGIFRMVLPFTGITPISGDYRRSRRPAPQGRGVGKGGLFLALLPQALPRAEMTRARNRLAGAHLLKKLSRTAGFDPTTPGFGILYSIRLSFGRAPCG